MYTVNFTNASKTPIVVNDNTTVGTLGPTSATLDPLATTAALPILLYGKGVLNWGERIQENLVQVLENFDGNVAPLYPTNGQFWHNNVSANEQRLYLRHESAWKNVLVLTDSNTAPSNPYRGQPWYSNANGYQYWSGAAWVPMFEGSVPLSGGSMTGFLSLFSDPTSALHAATKQYVDNEIATQAVTINGGVTIVNNLSLNDVPTDPLHIVNKQYVDGEITAVNSSLTAYLQLTGGALTGYLTLHADPASAMHAATKQYVDTVAGAGVGYTPVNRAGDTMTGVLILSSDPITTNLQAATKEYVDNAPFFNPSVGGTISGATNVSGVVTFTTAPVGSYTPTAANHLVTKTYTDTTFLRLIGGTLTGNVTQSATPSAAAHLINRSYADSRYLQLTGGTLSGNVTVGATFEIIQSTLPSTGNSLTNKSYVDGLVANYLALTGGTLTNFLTLHADPTSALHAATKQYVDTAVGTVGGSYVLKAGDSMTGALIVPDILLTSPPPDLSQVVNYSYINANYLSSNGGTVATKITLADPSGAGLPTLQGDLITLDFIQEAMANDILLLDGTNAMTGPLTLSADPVSNLQAATKQYVDAGDIIDTAGTTSSAAGVVTIDLASSTTHHTLTLSENITSWSFTNLPAAGKYRDVYVHVIQDAATARTVVSPATAGLTAGGTWTVSSTLSSRETLGLRVFSDGTIHMFPSGVMA